MNMNEKYQRLGIAIMDGYAAHGEKEIVVSFMDSPVLEYLSESVGAHLTVAFSKREREKRK